MQIAQPNICKLKVHTQIAQYKFCKPKAQTQIAQPNNSSANTILISIKRKLGYSKVCFRKCINF